MCEKCKELDNKIEHYERIRANIGDQITVDRIKELLEQMRIEKAVLHPDDTQQS